MFEQLADVFTSAAFKYLTEVDANPDSSNQHEIGGLVKAGLGRDIGMPDSGKKIRIKTTLVYLNEEDETPLIVEDRVTWYDTRYNQPHRSPEWRMYYTANDVSERFSPGDFFMISRTNAGELLMIFCPPGSDYETQMRTLFGVRELKANEKGLTKVSVNTGSIALPLRLMLSRYGIEIGKEDSNYLDLLLDRFGPVFPKTKTSQIFPELWPKKRVLWQHLMKHLLNGWKLKKPHSDNLKNILSEKNSKKGLVKMVMMWMTLSASLSAFKTVVSHEVVMLLKTT